jgi:hypothetical protein
LKTFLIGSQTNRGANKVTSLYFRKALGQSNSSETSITDKKNNRWHIRPRKSAYPRK